MQTVVSSHGFEYGVKHFFSPEDGKAIDIIQNALNLDHNIILDLFQIGAIYLNHQRSIQPEQSVSYGQMIRVHTKPRRYFVAYDWKSRVVFEHEDFIILNKPAGLPSHPSVDNILENSLTQLELALKTKLYISHRLDTTTEGLIVYGKKTDFVSQFNQQLQAKNVEKKYVALVQANETIPTHLIHYMEPSPRAPKKVSSIFTEGWDECELLIEKQLPYEETLIPDTKLLKINLLTGRTHQIRAQLSEAGFPLLGDKMYGSKIEWNKNTHTTNQIALKSCSIAFTYQTQRYTFELPENFD